MKKNWKIFWIICTVFLVIGMGLCALGVALGVSKSDIRSNLPKEFGLGPLTGDSFIGFSSTEHSDKMIADTEETFTNIDSIEADMDAGEMEFRKAKAGETEIRVCTDGIPEKMRLRFYVEGSTLKFETNPKGVNLFGLSLGTITVYVPENYHFKNAELDMDAGSIYIQDIQADELKISVDAGEITADHFLANEAELSCDAGSITAAGEVTGLLKMDCDVGEIDFTAIGKENDYNYTVNASIGEVVCGSYDFSGVDGKHEIDNHASKSMEIKCDIGSVEVQFRNHIK